MRPELKRVTAVHRASATNLVHYLALRRLDLRPLQEALAREGLSSLGRSESCVAASVAAVTLRVDEALAVRGNAPARRRLALRVRNAPLDWEAAQDLLHRNTRALLGARPLDRHIYVMVTAPSAKEADQAWMVRMLNAGMNVLRLNAAHEHAAEWARIVSALASARSETGKTCTLLMDLAGPKIRTGGVGPAQRRTTWKPTRDDLGRPVSPARVVLRRLGDTVQDDEPTLLIGSATFAKLRAGDVLRFRDARDKRRKLTIERIDDEAIFAVASDRAYVEDHVRARVVRGGVRIDRVRLGAAAAPAAIELRVGDDLVLATTGEGAAPRRARDGRLESPGVVVCTLPAALEHLRVGQRVFFDDGTIQCVVRRKAEGGREWGLRVVRTQKAIAKLRAEKGINLPDTRTTIPSMTADDERALAFAAQHADAVGLSFVRSVDDVRALHRALDRIGRPNLGVVLKIETRAGFESLPGLLLQGLTRGPFGIMIARGDLAVEVGWERLAELQEEILWLCEASHVPAIWATQVLDTLARTGVPSRAEVTDAAASVAAECVMLNKGPFVDQAVAVLSDILGRMEAHHYKKRSLYRRLSVTKMPSTA
jgi:pyruvate kinase